MANSIYKVTANGVSVIDLSDTTAVASDIKKGKAAHLQDGSLAWGTDDRPSKISSAKLTSSGVHKAPEDESWSMVSVEIPYETPKPVTPANYTQIIRPSADYEALTSVTINPIPGNNIVPTGVTNITTNGRHDVKLYEYADVDVQPSLGAKIITPELSTRDYIADNEGLDGYSQVTVKGIGGEYMKIPTETLKIKDNGVHNVVNYSTVDVQVSDGEIQLENKKVIITQNGVETYSAGPGYSGIDTIEVRVQVPPENISLQEKEVIITENKEETYYADNGYDGLSSIKVKVNVPDGDAPAWDKVFFKSDDTEIEAAIISGLPIEIATKEEMDSLLTTEAIGTVYKYIGDNVDEYKTDTLYIITETEQAVRLFTRLNIGNIAYSTENKELRELTAWQSVTELAPGFYDRNNILLASWDDLISTDGYGMNCETDYTATNYNTIESSPYNILHNKLEEGRTLVIGGGISRIGNNAFYGCSSIINIVIPDNIIAIGSQPFAQCSTLENIFVSPENQYYKDIDGILYTRNEESLILTCYSIGRKDETFKVPDEVIEIGDYAFFGCTMLFNIEIPEGVTKIGKYAFSSCSNLGPVCIPYGITTINMWTFSYCSKLTSITLPKSVTSIKTGAFAASGLIKIYCDYNKEELVVISIESNNTEFKNAERIYKNS